MSPVEERKMIEHDMTSKSSQSVRAALLASRTSDESENELMSYHGPTKLVTKLIFERHCSESLAQVRSLPT